MVICLVNFSYLQLLSLIAQLIFFSIFISSIYLYVTSSIPLFNLRYFLLFDLLVFRARALIFNHSDSISPNTDLIDGGKLTFIIWRLGLLLGPAYFLFTFASSYPGPLVP